VCHLIVLRHLPRFIILSSLQSVARRSCSAHAIQLTRRHGAYHNRKHSTLHVTKRRHTHTHRQRQRHSPHPRYRLHPSPKRRPRNLPTKASAAAGSEEPQGPAVVVSTNLIAIYRVLKHVYHCRCSHERFAALHRPSPLSQGICYHRPLHQRALGDADDHDGIHSETSAKQWFALTGISTQQHIC